MTTLWFRFSMIQILFRDQHCYSILYIYIMSYIYFKYKINSITIFIIITITIFLIIETDDTFMNTAQTTQFNIQLPKPIQNCARNYISIYPISNLHCIILCWRSNSKSRIKRIRNHYTNILEDDITTNHIIYGAYVTFSKLRNEHTLKTTVLF